MSDDAILRCVIAGIIAAVGLAVLIPIALSKPGECQCDACCRDRWIASGRPSRPHRIPPRGGSGTARPKSARNRFRR